MSEKCPGCGAGIIREHFYRQYECLSDESETTKFTPTTKCIESQRAAGTIQTAWKSIPKQTLLVEDGEIGDCWRCCIAAVLGVPATEVPHFFRNEDGTVNHNVDADTQRWLNERGYCIAYANTNGGREAFNFPRWANDKGFVHPPVISCGPTERSKGLGKHHAVVTINGGMVYDPHPSEAGLTAVTEQNLIFKIKGHNGY